VFPRGRKAGRLSSSRKWILRKLTTSSRAFFLEEVDLEKADNKLAKGFSSHY
jgi:hypothetical protein